MKNIKIIVVISLVLIIGLFFLVRCCEYEEDPLSKIEVGEMHDYRFDDSEIPEFDTVEKYRSFVHYIIQYDTNFDSKHYGVNDYWQLPEETLKNKVGECTDMCILFSYLIETRLNLRTKFYLVYKDGGSHIVVRVKDLYYDLVNNFTASNILPGWEIIYIISYPEVIWMTYYYHDNVGKYY